jgi:hypothetical protein
LVEGRLLAVELLAHRPRVREHTETEPASPGADRDSENSESATVITLAEVSATVRPPAAPSAQEIMWAHVVREQQRGRIPTGAELDRIAGTNNYGRTVLRQWREQGRTPADRDRRNGHRLVESAQGGAR